MSIILKGIDIEKYSQVVIIHPSGKVYKYDGGWRIDNNTPYQAIQISKGHGRLIDADMVDTWGWEKPCEDKLDNAPTILEAEE